MNTTIFVIRTTAKGYYFYHEEKKPVCRYNLISPQSQSVVMENSSHCNGECITIRELFKL